MIGTGPPDKLLKASVVSLVMFLGQAGARGENYPFTATVRTDYAYAGEPAMRMPTDVAVGAGGGVYVADGINDRILRFNADGSYAKEIREVGVSLLSRPVGVTVDGDGRLWIADTGNARVLALREDGRLERTIVPLNPNGDHAPDITDIAVDRSGKYVWLADNDNHRLIRVEAASGGQMAFGRSGESLGQLKYPFMLALGPDDSIFVTDVINARIQVFSESGTPQRALSGYGVDAGRLYRPKGIDCDPDGNVWVSDGTMGVIQVFTPKGSLIDMLRGEDGKPFRFRSPMGIALHDGDLFVAELAADRVRKLKITRRPWNAVRQSPEHKGQIVGRAGRACTVCHIEWIEPFSAGVGTLLMDVPSSTEEQPVVSRGETCLSCHDGSIVDSRRRVWQEHGHRTGIEPLPDMKVPPYLPLVNGKIACRTCHSAHSGGQFTGDISKSVFLRVPNTASQLCIGCHADKTRGPEFGTHPTGGMPWPVPQHLIDSGANVGPNPREITCQVCHTPHGAGHDHLLVLGTESNQLCLECHDRMRPGMFREGDHTEHPFDPPVNAAQKAAIEAMGTRVSRDNRLICLSCHKLHHGKGERFMLAQELTEGRMCLSCHSDKSSVLETSHDLRAEFPDERNRLGMTPHTGGPCSACHLFHRYARAPETNPIDPRGLCITCHQQDRCASSRTLGPLNHPNAKCTDCHNPHEAKFNPYLRAPAEQMCAECHKDQAKIAGGPHDVQCAPDKWSQPSLEVNDRCLACHRPHGTKKTGLFRLASKSDDHSSDFLCLSCHPQSEWGASTAHAAVHPKAVEPPGNHGLPLVHDRAGTPERIGCRTCHDPHINKVCSPKLLRIAEGEASTALCIRCHADFRHIVLTGHDTSGLSRAGLNAEACRPCHAVHADPSSLDRNLLSRLDVGSPAGNEPVLDSNCVICHRKDGPAPPPAIASHPDVPFINLFPSSRTSAMPLFDKLGRMDPQGAIGCLTCHLPHGRPVEDSPLLPVSEPEHRAMRLLLRPFSPPNLCTNCHGTDALRRFLYFHDPDRRNGPLEK